MSFYTTGPGDRKPCIKITIESDNIQDNKKVITCINIFMPDYYNKFESVIFQAKP